MQTQKDLQAAHLFAETFAASLAESSPHSVNPPWRLAVVRDEAAAPPTTSMTFLRLGVTGRVNGECLVGIHVEQFARLRSGPAGEPSDTSASQPQEVLTAVLSAAVEGMARSLTLRFGATTCKLVPVEDPATEGLLPVALRAASATPEPPELWLFLDPALLAGLQSTDTEAPPVAPGTSSFDPSNLQLVMDVELNVSLRFGQCQLPLREVLDLASGSVIELDRDVDDPVELLLDGRVIARGEAVIIDGNYGLRITEIPEPLADRFMQQR